MRWLIEVEVSTHDALRVGILCTDRRRIWVEADTLTHAKLAATQMAVAPIYRLGVIDPGEMPTRAEYIE